MPVLFPGVAESLDIRLLAAGCIDVDSWWATSDQIREIWRLYLCEEDGAALRAGDRLFPLAQNRIVIVPAGFEFEPVVERPVGQFFLHFELVGWPSKDVREVVPEPVSLDPSGLRDDLAEELRRELGGAGEIHPILASRLKALVHMSLSELIAGVSEERARIFFRIAEGRHELLPVLRFIDKNLGQRLTNMRLAEIAVASESRFVRSFREATGRTPWRYVQDRRLHRAAELLISTDQSIEEIADHCGFANRYYFTRVFAQRMGCPPARYRTGQPFISKDTNRADDASAALH